MNIYNRIPCLLKYYEKIRRISKYEGVLILIFGNLDILLLLFIESYLIILIHFVKKNV